MSATIGSLLLVVAGFGAWVASRRGWDLRVPDEVERADMSDPIAAIMLRHVAVDWLNEDMVDVVRATAAVTAYAQTGPLHRPERATPDRADTAAADDLTPGPLEP